MIETLRWAGRQVGVLDQRLLPHKKEYRNCQSYHEVADSITKMLVRGAPAIGVCAAMGIAQGAWDNRTLSPTDFATVMVDVFSTLAATRPTAVNLFWAIERMKALLLASTPQKSPQELAEVLRLEADKIYQDDIAICRAIGKNGAVVIPNAATILTHCNAGALATAGYGTALGVVRGAVAAGNPVTVFADETRPYLQGARLTAWELMEDNIPVTLITDSMAGYFMAQGRINICVVGADRIAANGDAANKIGTYMVAVLAKRHNIPFYVAAPLSTIDRSLSHGDQIPIEERSHDEVTHVCGKQHAPDNVRVENPAFDVTPAELITGIITEAGIAKAPYKESIAALFAK